MSRSELLLRRPPSSDAAEAVRAVRRSWWRRAERRPGVRLFGCAFGLYLGVGAALVFVFHLMIGDAVARVANGYYVLFSRDPHLGSMGFVWPPLPTLVLLPLLPFKALWPALVDRGFAGSIASAAFMAGATVQLRGILRDRGVSRLLAWTLTAAFALHPMIVFYGANGMTEAPFLFFLLTATRALARWLERNELRPLITTGVALACAYLTRYEALAAGVAAVAVVAVVSSRRATRERRREVAAADVAILVAPIAFVFVAWAAVSWIIVGDPFPEFTSVYGNASFVTLGAGMLHRGIGGMGRQLLVLEPLLFVVVGAAGLLSVRRRDVSTLAPASVIGGALAFQVAAFARGQTYGFLRYYIVAVPLAILLVATVLPRRSAAPGGLLARVPRAAVGIAVAAAVAVALPATAFGLRDVTIAPQEAPLNTVVRTGLSIEQRRALIEPFTVERAVAAYVDGLHAPRGSVLLDVAFGFPIVLDSRRPEQFVIPPDRDYAAALAAPSQFRIRYVLAIPNDGLGRIDAINRAYPTMFRDGAGVARLVKEFRGHGAPWRLYRVGGRS